MLAVFVALCYYTFAKAEYKYIISHPYFSLEKLIFFKANYFGKYTKNRVAKFDKQYVWYRDN